MPGQPVISVDARGLRCPWPALRLARAVREAGPGATIELVADDPAAVAEVTALAAERGWRLEANPPHFVVRA
ncbi:sulfurtransferase TusA family protein [Sphingosinicellaceae bacterium]|nr:sulfurtransferase TusA family protein [Sphingosinicellaceae bacterium]